MSCTNLSASTTPETLTAAASIGGTLARELVRPGWDGGTLRIGHPFGTLEIKIVMDGQEVLKAGTVRTARRIMDGNVYVELE